MTTAVLFVGCVATFCGPMAIVFWLADHEDGGHLQLARTILCSLN